MSVSLGIVTNASTSTGVAATINLTTMGLSLDIGGTYASQAISFQVLRTNTGIVYICDRPDPDLVTGLGVLWEMPVPTASTSIPILSVGNPTATNSENAAGYYILPAVGGEGVRVSVVR